MPEWLLEAQIHQESRGNRNAVSPAGARGIAQFIESTARQYGVNLNDGRTRDDIDGMAHYMHDNLRRTGGNVKQALSIYNSGRPDGYKSIPETAGYVQNILAGRGHAEVNPAAAPLTPTVGSIERTGRETVDVTDPELQHKQFFAQWYAQRHPDSPLIKLGVLDPAMSTTSQVSMPTLAYAPGKPRAASADPLDGYKGKGFHATTFDGKQVPSWMIPSLRFARAHGWTGTVTSGVRSTEEQARIWNSGVRPAARPGQSNHEPQNGGAIDVTDPEKLNQILRRFNGRRPIWAMSVGLDDPVHFSSNGR